MQLRSAAALWASGGILVCLVSFLTAPAFSQAPVHAGAELRAGAISAQPSAASELPAGGAEDEISALKQQIAEQHGEIEQLQRAIEQIARRLDQSQQAALTPARSSQNPNLGQVAITKPIIPGAPKASNAAEPLPVSVAGGPVDGGRPYRPVPAVAASPVASSTSGVADPQDEHPAGASPLQLRVGSAYITPVGFMDFTSVWRSKDGGSGIGTNFAGIPYGGAFQNHLSEFRFSMQNSRIGFRVDAGVKGAHVIGYMESDFLGNNPGNVAVSSNSNTLRSRLYWVDVRKGGWEVLGGQTWSLITPGRTGISPLPGDLFYTQDMDVNYQLGLVWGRIPELRVVYHPSRRAALAVALSSPEQYVGGSAGGSLITFPSALASTYAGELNVGSNTLAVPNIAPDVIAKVALDPSSRFHLEVGGVERNFKVWNPATAIHFSATGAGGFVNLNFEPLRGLRLLTNNFWSDGGGRYIFGQAPDLIARADGSLSPVRSGSTVTGLEYTHGQSLIFSYYGGLYVPRNVAIDTNGKPVGYGYSGAPSGQNRSVQEGTLGFSQTFWKDARYGALNLIGQYSYLTRAPWFVATRQPKNGHLSMVFLNLRYTLPGSAPTLGRK